MLVSRSPIRQKSMKNRCQIWWLKRGRQNHEKVMIFPNDLRPLLGRNSEKTTNKNEYGRFGTPWGCPWARKCRSGGGPKKCLHFSHEFDQMLAWFLIKMSCFFTCLFESLNLPPNQHKMYGTKRLFRKGCMYANHVIYRVERVCATNLRTGAWPKKSRTTHTFFVCYFIVFSRFCGFNLCINFWSYF